MPTNWCGWHGWGGRWWEIGLDDRVAALESQLKSLSDKLDQVGGLSTSAVMTRDDVAVALVLHSY
jgi:hypothetical protein